MLNSSARHGKWHYLPKILGCLLALGCTQPAKVKRPTIDELIQESFVESNEKHAAAVYHAELSGIPTSAELHSEIAAPTQFAVPPLDFPPLDAAASSPLVSEDCLDMDLREALLAIGESAGVDMIIDEKLAGIANVIIDNLPIEQAVEKLLMSHNFYHVRDGNQIFVGSADPASALFARISKQYHYRPQHLKATVLLSALAESQTKYVKLVDESNTLFIDAPQRLAERILLRFQAIDQPVPQVVLEAIVCVVSPESGFQVGTDWQHAVDINGSNAMKLGINGLAVSGAFSNQGLESVFSDFSRTSAFVNALCEHGYLSIRAAPHVTAQDGQKADIGISRETFFSIQPNSNNSGENNSFFFQQDIQKVESGISLVLTPHIRGDMVTINIEKAEVSEDIRTANADAALNPFPIINRRSVSTTVTVKDGKTIVIGGLVQRETVDRENKIPFFGDIPFVGYLFKTTQQQTRDVEVVIFLSPRIAARP
jgi:type IV pilus assembly protein PilQ